MDHHTNSPVRRSYYVRADKLEKETRLISFIASGIDDKKYNTVGNVTASHLYTRIGVWNRPNNSISDSMMKSLSLYETYSGCNWFVRTDSCNSKSCSIFTSFVPSIPLYIYIYIYISEPTFASIRSKPKLRRRTQTVLSDVQDANRQPIKCTN